MQNNLDKDANEHGRCLSSLLVMMVDSLINAVRFCVYKQPPGSRYSLNGCITAVVHIISNNQSEGTTARLPQIGNSSMIYGLMSLWKNPCPTHQRVRISLYLRQ